MWIEVTNAVKARVVVLICVRRGKATGRARGWTEKKKGAKERERKDREGKEKSWVFSAREQLARAVMGDLVWWWMGKG